MGYPFVSEKIFPILGVSFLYWIYKSNNLDRGVIIAFIANNSYYLGGEILKRLAK